MWVWLVLALLVSWAEAMRRWEYFIAPGVTFNNSEAYNSSPVSSLGTCKTRCFATDTCKAWTVKREAGTWYCLLAKQGPSLTTTLATHADSVYGFMEDSLTGLIDAVQETDGCHYFVPNLILSYQDAKVYCKKIPGFQLAMLKTTMQIDIGKKLGGQANIFGVFVDLLTTSQGYTWGDGTPYTGPVAEPMTTLYPQLGVKTIGFYRSIVNSYYFMCQSTHCGFRG
ncbi:hypothetical protein OTU49_017042 [Cherax quadricarinatus]|uniref:Apple domain-containing protein n=1 Tax=Cherax quadricarinatus TaxID=27406 RepID=A0AAW0Y355_CHEQU